MPIGLAEDALVDSGADTGSLGKSFKILNQDDLRKINVYGCREKFVAKGLRIGDGVTLATNKEGEKFFLRYNEGIIDPHGKSILQFQELANERYLYVSFSTVQFVRTKN